jgi:hypothetical protein
VLGKKDNENKRKVYSDHHLMDLTELKTIHQDKCKLKTIHQDKCIKSKGYDNEHELNVALKHPTK